MITLDSGEANLMAWEDERVGNDNILPSRRREDDDLGNVVGGKGVASAESTTL